MQELIDNIRSGKWGLSPKMTAIMGYLLKQDFTDPEITSIVITTDGCVMAQPEGDIGYNDFLGSEDDLRRNIEGMAECFGLSTEVKNTLLNKIKRYPGEVKYVR
jgi:hypothetical protein